MKITRQGFMYYFKHNIVNKELGWRYATQTQPCGLSVAYTIVGRSISNGKIPGLKLINHCHRRQATHVAWGDRMVL